MYHNPVIVIQTHNWVGECRARLDELAIELPLVITSEGGKERLRLGEIFAEHPIYSKVTRNPTLGNCQAAVDFTKNRKADGIIAIGGGSVMDTAKTVMAFLGTGIESVCQLLTVQKPFAHRVPAIFVPTTHGTGSEVTMWGTVWNVTIKKKLSLSHPDLYPDYAILDGAITVGLPLDVSLTTTLDALSHSFESIWNRNANPTSTALACEAIALILGYVDKLKDNPRDVQVRNKLLEASNKAGLAFSNTKTAAAHAISYPLTAHFGVPHGIASSIPLLPLLEINGPKIEDSLSSLLQLTGLRDLNHLKKKIESIPKPILKYRLSEWGVKKEDLGWIVTQCFTKDRMDNNAVTLTASDVRGVLESIY